MKYIRTKDGSIVDVKKFIEQEKKNPNYTNFKFDEIKNKEDYCYIHWTAVGTERNCLEDQRGRTVDLQASIPSPFIKQADTIEELCDCFIKIKRKRGCKDFILKHDFRDLPLLKEQHIKYPDSPVYGAIHIEDKGLIYVAKMNDKGELELL